MPKIVDHKKQRERIAKAACRAIAAHGLQKVRMVDIAAEADVTTGMILNYFDNKDTILAAALRAPFKNVIERTKALITDGGSDLYELLEPCIPATQELTNDTIVWVSFWGALLHDEKLADLNKALHQEANQVFEQAIMSSWPEAKDWPDTLMRDVRLSISTTLFGLSTGGVTNPDDWNFDALRRLLRLHLRMLRDWAQLEMDAYR